VRKIVETESLLAFREKFNYISRPTVIMQFADAGMDMRPDMVLASKPSKTFR